MFLHRFDTEFGKLGFVLSNFLMFEVGLLVTPLPRHGCHSSTACVWGDWGGLGPFEFCSTRWVVPCRVALGHFHQYLIFLHNMLYISGYLYFHHFSPFIRPPWFLGVVWVIFGSLVLPPPPLY